MLYQLAVQRLAIEAERAGSGGLVAGHCSKRANDVLAFDVGEAAFSRPARARAWTFTQPFRQFGGSDRK